MHGIMAKEHRNKNRTYSIQKPYLHRKSGVKGGIVKNSYREEKHPL